MATITRHLRGASPPPAPEGARSLQALLLGSLLAMAPAATADSSLATGTGPLRASAHVDFKVVVPPTLGIDLKRLAPDGAPVAPLTLGGAPAATANPGDLLAARVFANVGSVVVTAADHEFSETREPRWAAGAVSATASRLDTPTVLAHPPLPWPGIAAVTLTAQRSVVHQNARWSYRSAPALAGDPAAPEPRFIYTVQSP
jgi:hypothetical protein